MTKRLRIGIALGSGGAKGLAHIGVLQVLEEYGVNIDCVSGSSMGAVVGGIYALGYTPDEIALYVKKHKTEKKKLFKLHPNQESLYDTKTIHRRLYHLFLDKRFSDTKKPFFALATDLIKGKKVIFHKGKLLDAVEASSRIPLYLSPKKIGKNIFVDGGVLCPVPTSVLKKRCDFVIAVPIPTYNKKKHPHHHLKALNVLDRSLSILIDKLMRIELQNEQPDFIIDLQNVSDYSSLDYEKAEEIIALGRKIALRAIKPLLRKIQKQDKKKN